MGGSLIVGPIFDRGYCNYLIYTGTVMIVLGMMMTSICSQYWQFMLAQGICMGLGNGLLFIPAVAIIPTYFSSKRGIGMILFAYIDAIHANEISATGIAASGSSLGKIRVRL